MVSGKVALTCCPATALDWELLVGLAETYAACKTTDPAAFAVSVELETLAMLALDKLHCV
jgi:hypothetical protein